MVVMCFCIYRVSSKSMTNSIYKTRHSNGNQNAPSYANLFMGKVETTLQHIGHIQLGNRYIDDIFIITIMAWTDSLAELEKYIAQINSAHKAIKF